MDRINAIERVLDKRAGRGASDESLINWLKGLKNQSAWFNSVIDDFINAIKQTPLNFEADTDQGFQETKGRYELWQKLEDGRLLYIWP